MKKIRKLTAEDVELKPCFEKDGNAKYLVYIDSRAVTNLLDETYGMENWVTEYKEVAGMVVCRLSIYDEETNRWVYREETGSEKNIEKEKSIVSDAIKRCISRFGVTELYSAPNINLPKRNDYKVTTLEVNEERKISHLVISSSQGIALDWHIGQSSPTVASKDNGTILKEFCGQMKTQPGVNMDNLKEFFNYWNGRIESGQFNGLIQPEKLWNKKYGNVA